MGEAHISDITHAIQLAIAPVFLLTAIGTIINALIGRLGRAVDRRRVVEELLDHPQESVGPDPLREELGILQRRIVLTIRAIGLAVLSALLVCLLIGTAFAAAFVSLDLARPVALLFVAAVVALTFALMLFMHEIILAAKTVHPRMWPTPDGSRAGK